MIFGCAQQNSNKLGFVFTCTKFEVWNLLCGRASVRFLGDAIYGRLYCA